MGILAFSLPALLLAGLNHRFGLRTRGIIQVSLSIQFATGVLYPPKGQKVSQKRAIVFESFGIGEKLLKNPRYMTIPGRSRFAIKSSWSRKLQARVTLWRDHASKTRSLGSFESSRQDAAQGA